MYALFLCWATSPVKSVIATKSLTHLIQRLCRVDVGDRHSLELPDTMSSVFGLLLHHRVKPSEKRTDYLRSISTIVELFLGANNNIVSSPINKETVICVADVESHTAGFGGCKKDCSTTNPLFKSFQVLFAPPRIVAVVTLTEKNALFHFF
jgi:hypothetical protein